MGWVEGWGGGSFYIKSKLKKRKKMFFSVKNLNWEILTLKF